MAKEKNVRPGDPAPRGTAHVDAADVWRKDIEPHFIGKNAPAVSAAASAAAEFGRPASAAAK